MNILKTQYLLTTLYYIIRDDDNMVKRKVENKKPIMYGLMPIGEEKRRYRVNKKSFIGNKGDIIELSNDPYDSSWKMYNITSNYRVQPFIEFDDIEPYGWEMKKSNCPSGQEWVKGYYKRDGSYVHGFCRDKK